MILGLERAEPLRPNLCGLGQLQVQREKVLDAGPWVPGQLRLRGVSPGLPVPGAVVTAGTWPGSGQSGLRAETVLEEDLLSLEHQDSSREAL